MKRWFGRLKRRTIRSIIQRIALRRGFLDPFALLSVLRRFSRPSEVGEPIELLRAGALFHARGLINTKAIQHNMDWIWPYWIEQQFNPESPSFVPRAFSISHINLTHRNWTALGMPGCADYPIIDPRGLTTPLYDGWSIDAWILPDEGEPLIPSRSPDCRQELRLDDGRYRVETHSARDGLGLTVSAEVKAAGGVNRLFLDYSAETDRPASLAVALRPCNPEGVSFINRWERNEAGTKWRVNGEEAVTFESPPGKHHACHYHDGDVVHHLESRTERQQTDCEVGMITAAALYPMASGRPLTIRVSTPIGEAATTPQRRAEAIPPAQAGGWSGALEPACRLSVPDPHYQFLYDAAVRSLLLLSPGDIFPGPYTYRRFWFRDAALMLNALLAAGLDDLAERIVQPFPDRQLRSGYFRSQEGEWDSNGEVLWILHRLEACSGRQLGGQWDKPIIKAADWIRNKRMPRDSGRPDAGLMPAGFSAEHLGPNDHYYWDVFWSEAGLRCAADMLAARGEAGAAARFRETAVEMHDDFETSLSAAPQFARNRAIPASPYRRMDSGAVGSLCASYPLGILPPQEPRLHATARWLLEHATVRGGFFQDMIHSGINAYLTLHLAQVLLRDGDMRALELVQAAATLASPTGQWPEAIHPLTLGGCMGDGHHGWASAEWIMMLRNMIVREEGERLIIGSGIPAAWTRQKEPISLEGTLTPFGKIAVTLTPGNGSIGVELSGEWRDSPPAVEIAVPGYERREAGGPELNGQTSWRVKQL